MPDDERPEAAILSLDKARSMLPFKPVHSGHCRHRPATIDVDKRILSCDKCGANLDPFDFLAGLSHDFDLYTVPLERLKRELDATAAKLEETKRQERNAKARLKRLKAKLAERGE
jgi:hypothetical protein